MAVVVIKIAVVNHLKFIIWIFSNFFDFLVKLQGIQIGSVIQNYGSGSGSRRPINYESPGSRTLNISHKFIHIA